MSTPSANPADSWFGRPPPDFARLPAFPRPEPALHVSDVVINECLSLEAAGELHEAAARLRLAAKSDPTVIDRYNQTRRVLSLLEDETPAPDLASAVIAAMDRHSPFLPRRARRRVSAARWVVAGGILGAIGVAAFVHSQHPVDPSITPEVASLAPQPAPPIGVPAFTVAVPAPSERPASVVMPLRTAHALSFGDASRYASANWNTQYQISGMLSSPGDRTQFMPHREIASAQAPFQRDPHLSLLSPVAPRATVGHTWPSLFELGARSSNPGDTVESATAYDAFFHSLFAPQLPTSQVPVQAKGEFER